MTEAVMGWSPLLHADDSSNVRSQFKKSLSRCAVFEIECRYVIQDIKTQIDLFHFRFRRQDGQYRWHLVRAVPLKDTKGYAIDPTNPTPPPGPRANTPLGKEELTDSPSDKPVNNKISYFYLGTCTDIDDQKVQFRC